MSPYLPGIADGSTLTPHMCSKHHWAMQNLALKNSAYGGDGVKNIFKHFTNDTGVGFFLMGT